MEQKEENLITNSEITAEPKITETTTTPSEVEVKSAVVEEPAPVPVAAPPPILKTECEEVVGKPAALNVTNGSLADDSDEFSWEEYLLKTNARSAPPECFCQSDSPPVNEFKKGNKLETYDPRNTSSTCIATVIETHGPRLRLRLDGTDDRNDFWLMCDSELIHPYGYSEKLGRKIQPPLGFGKELSTWPKFLEKLVQQANDKQSFALEACFRPAPRKPLKNEFKEGDKLEAVDPKNPHLICPATVKEIKRDKLFISFDGWSQSSQFWVTFTSRDLFPCGWCSRAGHILQYPGNLEEKPHPVKQRTTSVNNVTINNTSTTTAQQSKSKPKVNRKRRIGSDANKNNHSIDNRSLSSSVSSQSSLSNNSALNLTYDTTTIDNNNNSNIAAKPANTSISLNKSNAAAVKSKQELVEEKPDTTKENKNNAQTKETSNKNASASVDASCSATNGIDLSMIKSEPTEYAGENLINTNDNTAKINTNGGVNNTTGNSALNGLSAGVNGTTQSPNPNNSNKINNNIIIYVNPKCDCGKHIISYKFHKSHTKFGPGQVHSVYKSILQSFVDCANNRQEVFKMIPTGKSNEYVRLKTTQLKEKKNIRPVTSIKELWTEIKSFCKLLGIDDANLFSTKMFKRPKVIEKHMYATNSTQPPLNNIENIHNATSTPTASSSTTQPAAQTARKTHSNIELSQPVSSTSDSAKSGTNQNERTNSTASTSNVAVNSSHSDALIVKSSTPVAQKRRHSPVHSNHQNNNTNTNNLSNHQPQQQTNSSTAINHDQQNGSVHTDLENSSLDHSNQVPVKINRLDSVQNNPITDWTIEQVVNYVQNLSDNYFASYLEMFRHHEIDGKALLLLTTDILMKYMGFKLGPALKLNNYLDKLRNHNKQQQQQQQ